MGASDAVAAYGAAWNEADPAARRTILDAVWAADGVYCDPSTVVEGRDALSGHIGGFQEQMAGHAIVTTSGVEEHHGWFRFAWRLTAADGTPVVDGFDVGELDDDGRIRRIVGFFGPFPPPEGG